MKNRIAYVVSRFCYNVQKGISLRMAPQVCYKVLNEGRRGLKQSQSFVYIYVYVYICMNEG